MVYLLVPFGILFIAELCASQCSKTAEFTALRGQFSSPSYNNGKYARNLNCAYRIKAPENYRIKVKFIDLDITPSTSCTEDKLIIHGKDKESIIGIFCGHQIPRPILSHEDENEVLIEFITESAKSGRGFRIQYESSLHFDLCSKDEGLCRNRNCYSVNKTCDGVDDCKDGTDEEDCNFPVAIPSDKCGITPIKPNTIYGARKRMIGGEKAVPNSWPWQASIQRRYIEPNGHFCGGTLISAQWVLSAARCFLDAPYTRSIRINLGSHRMFNKSNFEQIRVAEKIIAYPDLEGEELKEASLEDDVALIKLNAPVLFTDGVQPACLPYGHWETKPGWTCYTTGWGETRGDDFSDELMQSQQVIKHVDHCLYDDEKQICVNIHSQATCDDDAGSPLVCKLASQWYLLGVTSHGAEESVQNKLCSTVESDVLFAKVAHKSDWIRETINKYQ